MANSILSLCFLFLSIFYPPQVDSEGATVQSIDAVFFMEKVMEENNHLLVDVRTKKKFLKNRIPGSVSAATFQDFVAILDTMDLERPILIYCDYGERSNMASQKVVEKYGISVFHLEGGLKSWMKRGFEIDRHRLSLVKN